MHNFKRTAVFAFILAIAISVGAAGPARAATINVFSDDLAGWTAAAGGIVVVEDFSDEILVAGMTLELGSDRGSINGDRWRDRADDTQETAPTFTFAGEGITAFGADWDVATASAGTGLALFVTFTDSTTQLVTAEIPQTFRDQFWGIVSDTAIRSISVVEGTQDTGYETFDGDNVRFAAAPAPAAAAPEPGSASLLVLGGAFLVSRLRKRRVGER